MKKICHPLGYTVWLKCHLDYSVMFTVVTQQRAQNCISAESCLLCAHNLHGFFLPFGLTNKTKAVQTYMSEKIFCLAMSIMTRFEKSSVCFWLLLSLKILIRILQRCLIQMPKRATFFFFLNSHKFVLCVTHLNNKVIGLFFPFFIKLVSGSIFAGAYTPSIRIFIFLISVWMKFDFSLL